MLLGLGSSDPGRAREYLRAALRHLKATPGFRLESVSPIYRSEAMLPPGAPDDWNVSYLNIVVRGCADELPPETWLARFKAIERALGRRERERWAPREIDIDLLAWDARRFESPSLRLPHVGMASRPFVLRPLADVAPDWVHPDGREAQAIDRAQAEWSAAGAAPFGTQRTTLSLTDLAGIVNLTPDSFSDGGRWEDLGRLEAHLADLVEAGVTILDVGAESTRPDAQPLDPTEELRRIEAALPALERVRSRNPQLRWSLDSRHARTVRESRERFPWDIVNDVGGFSDPSMWEAAYGVSEIVAMHSLGVPPRRDRVLPADRAACASVAEWMGRKIQEAAEHGWPRERVSLDPGLGFGKTIAQNFALLHEIGLLHQVGAALWVGHSRKSFLGGKGAPAERDFETSVLSAQLERHGVEILRVHAPRLNARAIAATKALGSNQDFRA